MSGYTSVIKCRLFFKLLCPAKISLLEAFVKLKCLISLKNAEIQFRMLLWARTILFTYFIWSFIVMSFKFILHLNPHLPLSHELPYFLAFAR